MGDLSAFPDALASRYRPLRLLGEGGMGAVYLAREEAHGREVAVKVLKGEAIPQGGERLSREGKVLAQIRHPNVVEVYDVGELPSGPYLVMEHVEGSPLSDVGPEVDALEALLPVADALETMHAEGVVHRDVKPQNIMMARDGRPVLLDFGIVKARERTAMTASGMVLGTPAFLAPEGLRGGEITPALDWYAWGVSLYVLLEGTVPFKTLELLEWLQGDEKPALRFRALHDTEPRAVLIRACLEEDPGRRPAGRAGIEALLEGTAPGEPATFATPRAVLESRAPEGVAEPSRSSAGRGLAAAGLGVAVALGLAVAGVGGGAPSSPAGTPPTASGERAPPRLLEPLEARVRGFPRYRNTRADLVLIRVPAGPFESRASPLEGVRGDRVTQDLDAFLVGETEVTVRAYARFLGATGHREPAQWERQRELPELPVSFVDHADARAFARWAGGRLPTALEWERVATGPRGARHPWGEREPTRELANFGHYDLQAVAQPLAYLEPVGSFPRGASPCGALDLLGNVAEWAGGGEVPGQPGRAYLLGGSYLRQGESLKSGFLYTWPMTQGAGGTGLRLAMDPPG